MNLQNVENLEEALIKRSAMFRALGDPKGNGYLIFNILLNNNGRMKRLDLWHELESLYKKLKNKVYLTELDRCIKDMKDSELIEHYEDDTVQLKYIFILKKFKFVSSKHRAIAVLERYP